MTKVVWVQIPLVTPLNISMDNHEFDFYMKKQRQLLQDEGIRVTAGLRYCVYINNRNEALSSFSNKKAAIMIAKRYLNALVLDCKTAKFIFRKTYLCD